MRNVLLFILSALMATAVGQGFYQNTDVYEVVPDSFDEVILNTNYTSIVEFYAPWCGHCNKFKGAYKKTGKLLKDLVNVAAVNCDLEINKPLCAKYKVEGFPTVMVFRPPKYSPKRPPASKAQVKLEFANENYLGERTSKGLVSFAQTRVKSYVKRIFEASAWKKFVEKGQDKVRVILLTGSKNKPSLFLKSLAIDYLGVAEFAYFDTKGSFSEKEILDVAGVESVEKPLFLAYGKGSSVIEPKVLKGDLSKEKIAEFLASNFDVKPLEGPGSDRQSLLEKVKKGKSIRQAKKSNKSSSKKESSKKKTEKTKDKKKITRDEL